MTPEQLLRAIEHLIKPILKDSQDINYGRLKHVTGPKEGIEFVYKDKEGEKHYVRIEIK